MAVETRAYGISISVVNIAYYTKSYSPSLEPTGRLLNAANRSYSQSGKACAADFQENPPTDCPILIARPV
jgi:hypothetical protein